MEHLDFGNPGTFEKEDLERLIKKAVADISDVDKKRKTEFKECASRATPFFFLVFLSLSTSFLLCFLLYFFFSSSPLFLLCFLLLYVFFSSSPRWQLFTVC